MKLLLTLFLLIVSSYALATSTLSLPLTSTPLNEQKTSSPNLATTQTLAVFNEKGTMAYQHVSPQFWHSNDKKISLNEITITKMNWIPVKLNEFTQSNLNEINGVSASYHDHNMVLSLGLLNNDSLQAPQEKIFIEGSLTIWTMENFNLTLNGRIETQNYMSADHGLMNNLWDSQEGTRVKKSLSVTGSYTFSDTWALTGTMISSDLNRAFKQHGVYKKSSDNVAIIGTTYSF